MKTALRVRLSPGRGVFCRVLCVSSAVLALTAGSLLSQIAIPATPKKFTKRIEGSGSTNLGPGLAPVAPKPPPQVRTITYYTLSDSRQWTSSDGKPLLAKLVAFEEVVVETQGNPPQAQAPPQILEHPTVVRDGKARLLSGKTAYEVPLDRLSQADRDFIEGIRVAAAAPRNSNVNNPAASTPAPAASPAEKK